MYGVIDGITKSIGYAYGVIASVTRKINKIYGVIGGTTKLIWEAKPESGEILYTASGTFTVPDKISTIDIFCVGGGGGGGGYSYRSNYESGMEQDIRSGGGAGGYTATALSVSVTPGETLNVVVGAGGERGLSFDYNIADKDYSAGDVTNNSQITSGSSGGTSSLSRGSTALCTANGGGGGYKANYSSNVGGSGGRGGSGGGKGSYYYCNSSGSETYKDGVNRGIDGADGGGKGQGTTTRYFAEAEGTLYSSGGEAEAASCPAPNPNTGHGGPGSWANKDGASGCVIIRWSRS